MGKKNHSGKKDVEDINKKEYEKELYDLQVELAKLQNHLLKNHLKILIILEGRDTAGKDGTIKSIIQNLSPRDTRVVALNAPTERERSEWYFQRYVPHLPAGGEFVLFNRSWYNRAGVEKVMGFCTDEEYKRFFEEVLLFEQMLISSGVILRKYYLDITKDEQKKRMKERAEDPVKQWKISPIDQTAQKNWDKYTAARDEMLARTHCASAPWKVARANNKRLTHLNLIRDFLAGIHYKGRHEKLLVPDPEIVFSYDDANVKNGLLST